MPAATTTRPSFLAIGRGEARADADVPGGIPDFHQSHNRQHRPALQPGPLVPPGALPARSGQRLPAGQPLHPAAHRHESVLGVLAGRRPRRHGSDADRRPAGTRPRFGDDDPGGRESPPESESGRLEAFSDCVLAVIITIMAFELRAPARGSLTSLRERFPALLVYVLSFAFIGIYWNNHHHLLRAARRVTAGVMWANLHLLFWLSLIPVLTEWIGEQHGQSVPAATYGLVCLAAALAFMVLVGAIIHADGSGSPVAAAPRSSKRILGDLANLR
jgi:uncharacterized membrane protein